jgi:hypothetical protein
MARPRSNSDALRYPLDEIVGSRAGVRLLRLLAHEVDSPLSAPDAADRAGLTSAGARRALERLVQTGFVVRVGGGRSEQYEMRAGEPLVDALRLLFQQEHDRYDIFVRGLRDLLEGTPDVVSAWIGREPTVFGDAVEITAVVEAASLPWIREHLRTGLAALENRFDQVIEMTVLTRADAPEPKLESIIPLAGVIPLEWPPPRVAPASHSEIDDRALRLSRGIAQLLRQDPSLAKRAQRHVERLVREDQGSASGDLREWAQVLATYSPERLRSLLVSTSPRAARLRQSSPFFAALTAEERDALVQSLEEHR